MFLVGQSETRGGKDARVKIGCLYSAREDHQEEWNEGITRYVRRI